jgi:hypothetical protein
MVPIGVHAPPSTGSLAAVSHPCHAIRGSGGTQPALDAGRNDDGRHEEIRIMAIETSHHYRSSGGIESPADDQTYDLLQVLTSKLEAIEAYAKYEQDADDEVRQLLVEIARDDAGHAERLMGALQARLGR